MVLSETLRLTIRYEAGEQDRIVASIPQVLGALRQGRAREEARANVLEALLLLLSPEPGQRGDSESLELTIGC